MNRATDGRFILFAVASGGDRGVENCCPDDFPSFVGEEVQKNRRCVEPGSSFCHLELC